MLLTILRIFFILVGGGVGWQVAPDIFAVDPSGTLAAQIWGAICGIGLAGGLIVAEILLARQFISFVGTVLFGLLFGFLVAFLVMRILHLFEIGREFESSLQIIVASLFSYISFLQEFYIRIRKILLVMELS